MVSYPSRIYSAVVTLLLLDHVIIKYAELYVYKVFSAALDNNNYVTLS